MKIFQLEDRVSGAAGAETLMSLPRSRAHEREENTLRVGAVRQQRSEACQFATLE